MLIFVNDKTILDILINQFLWVFFAFLGHKIRTKFCLLYNKLNRLLYNKQRNIARV